jgi:hypothetical protein
MSWLTHAAPGKSEPVDETFLHEVVRRAPRLIISIAIDRSGVLRKLAAA